MKTIQIGDLELIGGGGNTLVYRPKVGRIGCDGCVFRVPRCNRLKGSDIVNIWSKLCDLNIPTLSFVKLCLVDGKEALLCEDLCANDRIYVSPNSVETDEQKRLRKINDALYPECHKTHIVNVQEQTLYKQKITGICNVRDFLNGVKLNLKRAAADKIFLDFDCYFFGFMPTTMGDVIIDYKIADFDNILIDVDDSELYEKMCELFTETFTKFIRLFVAENKQEELLVVIESFKWE